MSGAEQFVPSQSVPRPTSDAVIRPRSASGAEFDPKNSTVEDIKPQKLHAERFRPRLQTRHSYAGHGRDAQEVLHQGRPAGPKRTATHAPGTVPQSGSSKPLPQRLLSTSTMREGSLNDPEYSTVADARPHAEIFSISRDLDDEIRPLLEPGGITRVLERGRVVAVTRDYLPENADLHSRISSKYPVSRTSEAESPTGTTPKPFDTNIFANYRNVFAADNTPSMFKDYEEYEQHPTSPWSQSPAPSPAIQADEDVNPFFTSQEEQVENAFNPAASPKDYSQFSRVEAIGVEHASTVIHVPLIHPTLSQPMQPLRTSRSSEDLPNVTQRSNTMDTERKMPIAILSILTPTVPYPPNLQQVLKLFGPHLATSFAISEQFSLTHPPAVAIRHRRTGTEQTIGGAPMTLVPTSIEDIMNAEVEGPSGSVSTLR